MSHLTSPVIDRRRVPSYLPLTTRQHEIFCWIFGSTLRNGFQPSYADIMCQFRFAGRNGVACHLTAIARKGWIAIGDRQGRAIRFLRNMDGSPFKGFSTKT